MLPGKPADYTRFKRKLILQSAALLDAAAAIIGLLYFFVWRDNAGDILVEVFQRVFDMSHVNALIYYDAIFRQNAGVFFVVGIVVVFFVLIWVFSRNITRYFDAINSGIDALIVEGAYDIVLMPEMEAIEDKLNAVRLALAQRKQDAQQAERRKDELVMYLAHDTRTPLTSVIGYLSLLVENPELDTQQRAKYLGVALDKAHRLESLIEEFFEITRLNSADMALRASAFELSLMLAQVVDEFYPQLQESGRQAVLHTEDDLLVCGDADKLARAFGNLMRNALAYSDGDGPIEIAAWHEQKTAKVTITNPGTIAEDKLQQVFEKFYRLDRSRSSDKGGSGLGLAIAAEIVSLHGGAISARSDEGKTTFVVELPREHQQACRLGTTDEPVVLRTS
jgi:two-component system sensor histidine kinase VanS